VINRVEPGLIRVEADEVTYGLHIMLRFELENDLVNGRLPVSELPRAWNDRMEAYLGIRPKSDANGVLQDIHWSMGAIGYFPDYLLGSLFSVQLWDAMRAERPHVESEIERGDFGGVLAWLEGRVMKHGRKFTLPELAERAVGGPLRFEPYMDYLRERYGRLYGVG
jgi:carboxypeptidase Taq